MKKILITGGSGFVGSELMNYLKFRPDHKVVFDIELSPRLNICDDRILERTIPEFDTIVHLAAIVGEPACVINPELSYKINVDAVRKIVQHTSMAQQFIFMSTSSVYGNRPGEVVDEKTPPLPTNNYARQKFEAEEIVKNNLRNYIIFRPVTAFGVSRRIRLDLLVNTLIYEALTTKKIKLYEPNIIRPMIHVTDFARFIVHAIDGGMKTGEIYNIGDPSLTVTKAQLAQKIAAICDAEVVPVEGTSLDLRDYNISFNKIRYMSTYHQMNYGLGIMTEPFMKFDLKFTKDPLNLAVHQLKSRLHEITDDPDKYSTPARTKKLFAEHGDSFKD